MAAYTTIDDPSAYFKVQLYTGNGSANHAITFDDTDTDMQPDIVWIKNRDATDDHCLFDEVRGATKIIHPSSNAYEATDADTLDSFTSDGFQVDADVKVNTDGEDYVAWCWKVGTTSGIDTTGADITLDDYSFNQAAGVSVVVYDGNETADQQIPHGLGSVAHLIIIKEKESTAGGGQDWRVYHHKNTSAPATEQLVLNENYATEDVVGAWHDTVPTSVLFTVGVVGATNKTGVSHVAYCFSEKQGYSKFGGYTGNGNADGTFVYTGFRPAYVLCKRTNSTADWMLYDNKRIGFNPENFALFPDGSGAESFVDTMNIMSNGFKPIATSVDINGSGDTYIYAAFAEAPFVNSNGVPCNAR
jgi:hypothetical protein